MNKYESAVRDYYFWRSEISRLTKEISKASLSELDFDPYLNVFSGGLNLCSNMKKYNDSSLAKETCIERMWQAKKITRSNAEIAYDMGSCLYEEEEYDKLCDSCAKVDFLIQERKIAKKKLATTKTRIFNLGKGIKCD